MTNPYSHSEERPFMGDVTKLIITWAASNVTALIIGAVAVGGYKEKVDAIAKAKLVETVSRHDEVIKQNFEHLKDIETSGTKALQSHVASEQEESKEIQRRVGRLEVSIDSIAPDVREIKVRLEDLQKRMEEKK